MESKTIIQPSSHSSQPDINEENLNKNSKDAQSQENQNSNNQLSISQHKKYFPMRYAIDKAQHKDFTKISLLKSENLVFNSKAYQEYIKTFHKITSLYYMSSMSGETKLFIYNTKCRREKIEVIDQEKTKIDFTSCIAPLPNGDLFYFGSISAFRIGIAALIDHDFNIHELPSGKYCWDSSAIYYNKSVYCFGGTNSLFFENNCVFCKRFDLDKNIWINLSPIPEPAINCTTVIFNGNILISSPKNINLWLYSIDIDSFSIIPFKFKKQRKIMTNAGDRIYLIESDIHWFIYESNVGDEFSWKFVAKLKNIEARSGNAYSCIYNKEKERIYIGSVKNQGLRNEVRRYYKFNLNKKVLKENKRIF